MVSDTRIIGITRVCGPVFRCFDIWRGLLSKNYLVTLQSSIHLVTILTDHAAARNIVNHATMSSVDMMELSPMLMNTSMYLSQYLLNVVYMVSKEESEERQTAWPGQSYDIDRVQEWNYQDQGPNGCSSATDKFYRGVFWFNL